MKLKHFLNKVEHARVHQAVREAEAGTTVDIVIYISHRQANDPLTAAQAVFQKLKLETEKKKMGLLFFIAPKSRKFAVLGGTALHEKLGQVWWDRLAEALSADFKREKYTDGLVSALGVIAPVLKSHFPGEARREGEVDLVEE